MKICGTNLEIISKRPVSEHLEERVMCSIEADIVEVVVLSADTDAFLTVDDASVASHFTLWIDGAQK